MVNKVILIGRLGQDPELKYTPSGSAVCNLSLATSEYWKDKNTGQKQERTEWHRIVVWARQAETCHQYLTKGRQIFVEGRLQTRSWDDKNGNKRYTTEIMAQSIQFLGGGASANAGPSRDERPAMDAPSPSFASEGSDFSSSKKATENSNEYKISTEDRFTSDDIPF